jgi:hypothetical protein
MTSAIEWTLAFFGMAVLDAAWAFYTIALVQKRHYNAGFVSAFIFILGAVVVRMYVSDGWIILPATAGAYAGTVIGSKYAVH